MRKRPSNYALQKLGNPHYYAKLQYVDLDNPTLDASLTTYVTRGYSVNTLYRVDGTTAGLFPGLAAYGTIYANYKVLGVRYRVEVANNTTNNTTIAIQFTPDSNTVTDVTSWSRASRVANNPHSKTFMLGSYNGGNSIKVFKGFIRMSQLVGNKALYIGDADYAGSTGAAVGGITDPAKQLYMYLLMYASNGTTIGTQCQVKVHLEPYVKFYNPQTIYS